MLRGQSKNYENFENVKMKKEFLFSQKKKKKKKKEKKEKKHHAAKSRSFV